MVNRGPPISLTHELSRYVGADTNFLICFLEKELVYLRRLRPTLVQEDIKKCQPKTFAFLTKAFGAKIDLSKCSGLSQLHAFCEHWNSSLAHQVQRLCILTQASSLIPVKERLISLRLSFMPIWQLLKYHVYCFS